MVHVLSLLEAMMLESGGRQYDILGTPAGRGHVYREVWCRIPAGGYGKNRGTLTER